MSETEENVVYWIHCHHHTDPTEEGYIGITNNFNTRIQSHKHTHNPLLQEAIDHYKWDNLVKEVLHTSDRKNCLAIELGYRPRIGIGLSLIHI